MGIVDRHGRPLKSRQTMLKGVLNENAYHWARETQDVYYNPDNIKLDTYERMYTTDETVFSGIEFLVMAALARLGEYTNPDRKQEDFVRRQLVEMRGSFPAKVADIMTAAPYGFSLTEIIWKVSGREIGIADLQTLHPATIHLDLHRSGPLKNQPRVAYQFFRQHRQAKIPLQKAILYSHGAVFGNAYGVSRLKRAYAPWFIKNIILKAWGLCCERYGSPYMVGKTKGVGQINVNGTKVNAVDHLANVLDSMSGKGSAVIGIEDIIDIKYAGTGYGDDFENLVAYCNKMIYRALGLPSLIADHGNTGSYSLGKQHFQLFILVLQKLLFEVIDVLVEQLVRPLIEMNFGAQEDYGTFSVEEFEEEDAKVIAETVEVLARTGLVNMDKIDDINHFRERLGLQLWEEEDLQPSAPPPIKGLDPEAETAPDATLVTDEEILEARERAAVYNFSWKGRRAAQRAKRKALRLCSRREVQEMAARMAELARPA